MPSPTPRPTLTELVLAADRGVASELFCEGVLELELAITLFVEEVDDVKAVDELELEELDLDELDLDEVGLDELELEELDLDELDLDEVGLDELELDELELDEL